MTRTNYGQVMLALLVTAPFMLPYHQPPLVTLHTEWMALVLGLVFSITVMVQALISRVTVVVPRFTLPLAMLVTLLLAQALWLRNAQPAVLAAMYLGVVLLVAMSAATLHWNVTALDRQIPERTLLQALAVGGVLMTAGGFIQRFGIDFWGYHLISSVMEGGMMGTLGQRNLFAAYLCCGLSALVALRTDPRISLPAGALMLTGMAYSDSRVAWVLLCVVLAQAWLSSAHYRQRYPLARGLMVLGALGAVQIVFAVLRFAVVGDQVTRGVHGAASAVEGITTRWSLVEAALRVWWTSPVLGVGWGEFALQQLLTATGPELPDRHSHNVLVQLLAETGVVGCGLVLTAVGLWLWGHGMRVIQREAWADGIGETRTRQPLDYGLYGVLWIMAVFSLTEFPLWHAEFLLLTVVAMALLPQTSWNYALHRPVIAVASAGLMVAVLLLVQYREAELFLTGSSTTARLRSFWRPQLEQGIVAALGPDAPAEMVERSVHMYPHPEIVCAKAMQSDPLTRSKLMHQLTLLRGPALTQRCYDEGRL